MQDLRQRAVRSDIVRDEVPWVEHVTHAGVVTVRDELRSLGLSRPKSAAIALWLNDQANGHRERTRAAEDEATRYRAELRRLGPPDRNARVRAIPGQFKTTALRRAA